MVVVSSRVAGSATALTTPPVTLKIESELWLLATSEIAPVHLRCREHVRATTGTPTTRRNR